MCQSCFICLPTHRMLVPKMVLVNIIVDQHKLVATKKIVTTEKEEEKNMVARKDCKCKHVTCEENYLSKIGMSLLYAN